MIGQIKEKVIVFDTNIYAGNFERKLCAYVTGIYGDCSVGRQIAEDSFEELAYPNWYIDHILQVADDHGCYRPVTIYPNPRYFNDGAGNLHLNEVSDCDAIKTRDMHYAKQLDEGKMTPQFVNMIQNIPFTRYPAYMSVAIFVDEFPDQPILDEMIHRATEFLNERDIVLESVRTISPNAIKWLP